LRGVNPFHRGSSNREAAARQRLCGPVTTGRKARFDDGHEEDPPIVKTGDPDRIDNRVHWNLGLTR